jgi:hypothetical protein
MPVLMIGEIERKKRSPRRGHRYRHAQTERSQTGFERPPSQHILLPGGYRASYSVEQQPPGLCSHLSVSVFGRAKKGACPSPEAVQMIAEEFGVPFPADKMWMEEFDPGEFAINLVSLYAPTEEGHA